MKERQMTEVQNTRTVSSASAVIPKNKFSTALAHLREFAGLARKEVFYRCEYNLEEVHNAFETDSYLRTVATKYGQLIFKAGYSFKGKNDEALSYLNERIRIMDHCGDEPFDLILMGIARDLEIYANAFIIKTRIDPKDIPFVSAKGIVASGKAVNGYARVPAYQITIKYDNNGKIIGYKQKVQSGREKVFKPEDVIHFTLDREAGSVWGTPRCIAALEDIKILRKEEGHALSLTYRYSMPIIQAMVGIPQQGLEATEKEIQQVKQMINKAPADGMFVTPERVQFKVIGAEGNALDLNGYLSYFEKRVFTALNASNAMVGRDSAKQDADAMEGQVHDIVKNDQKVFSIQVRNEIINELLLEGGYNPILNEDDIVTMDFNEINLDTKIKQENHEIVKFEKSAQTFEELRQHLGMKKDEIDEMRLCPNMIAQQNALEQIDVNHENAIEIAELQGDIQERLARVTAAVAPKPTSSSSSGSSSSSSKKKVKMANSGRRTASSYVRRNTGNGKNINTASRTKTATSIDRPQNQYGTFSVKIKESLKENNFTENACRIYNRIAPDISDHKEGDRKIILAAYKQQLNELFSAKMKDSCMAGTSAAFADMGTKIGGKTKQTITYESQEIQKYTRKTIDDLFSDIEKTVCNSAGRADLINGLDTIKYRIRFLANYVQNKSFWYSYIKTLDFQGVDKVEIRGRNDSSHHDEHHGKILRTNNFSMKDIPGYSPGCTCYLVPVKSNRKRNISA